MKGVFILAGVLIVLTGAVMVWMIIGKAGQKMFSSKKNKEINK